MPGISTSQLRRRLERIGILDATGAIPSTSIPALSSKADLVDGKVPAAQLPEGQGGGLTMSQVKADADISSALSLKHANVLIEHGHGQAAITGLESALSGKVAANSQITGAQKTKITYDAKGLVTAGADATTADVADSSDKRYCTDAQKTVIQNTSGSNSGDGAGHSGLEVTANKGAVSGYCGLSASQKVAIGNLPTGATVNDVCIGNDGRLSDARTPVAHNQGADTITTNTLDGDRLPALSSGKKGGCPATGSPSGKYLKDDGTWAAPGGGSPPAWYGLLYGSLRNGDPSYAADCLDILNTVAGPTPTGITTSIARCVLVKTPQSITINKIRLFAIAAVASLYKFAIYPKTVGSSRSWESGVVTTVANAWLNIAAGLPVTLPAGEYWFCVTAANTGTTAAFRTPAAPLHSAVWAASAAPLGNRNMGLAEYAQFAVTAGAFPATLPSIVAAAYGAGATGTVPVAFLDNSAA